jgi:sec-independent protein translocase protein TatC
MTLGEHLDELRTRLIRCLVAVAIGAGLAFWRAKEVIGFLQEPVQAAIRNHHGTKFVQRTVGEGFMTAMMVSLFAGIALAGPYLLYQIWGFVAAGLYSHERRSVKFYVLPGFVLFFCGAAMAYLWVMPWALEFLVGFAADTVGVESYLDIGPHLTLVAWMMLVFGLVFQLPLIMVFLMRLGVVEPATFRRHRKMAIVVAFVVGALLTPPDVISQCIMSGTLIGLYEGAILVGARVGREREAAA